MKTIYLIRHGKASLEGTDRERGLTEEGVEHANQVAKILTGLESKVDKIYSSPLKRAILTIEPTSSSFGTEIKIIEELKEKITGDTAGRDLNEEKRKMWEDFDSKLPGGESSQEASTRALSALDKIKSELQDGECAVVQCHGTLIALLLHHFDNSFGFNEWKSMTMPDIYKILSNDNGDKVEHVGVGDIETFKIGK